VYRVALEGVSSPEVAEYHLEVGTFDIPLRGAQVVARAAVDDERSVTCRVLAVPPVLVGDALAAGPG
jgi:hypothetical protein